MPTKAELQQQVDDLTNIVKGLDCQAETMKGFIAWRDDEIAALKRQLKTVTIEKEILLKIGQGILADTKDMADMVDDLLADRRKGAVTNVQRHATRDDKIFEAYIWRCAIEQKPITRRNCVLSDIRQEIAGRAFRVGTTKTRLSSPKTLQRLMPSPWEDEEVAEMIKTVKAAFPAE